MTEKYIPQKLFEEPEHLTQHLRVTEINQRLGQLAIVQKNLTKEWNNLQAERLEIQIEWQRKK